MIINKFTLRFKKQHLFNILLICLSTVASLLLGEIVLRFVLPKSYYIWTPNLKVVFKPHQDVIPGISGPARFVTNSHGIRGDELTPSHTYRILTIGGSTTECLFLDQYETWPYLLQQTLNENTLNHNVWVGNAGMSGMTTRHHLIAMQYLPLREMRIDAIILLIGINDFSIRLSQNENYNPNYLVKPEAAKKLIYETFTGGSHPNLDDPLYKKTAIWQMLRKVKRMVIQKNAQDNIQDETGQIYVTWRKHRRQASEIRNELPDLSSAIEEYTRNINKMIEIAQEKSVRLIFITQPTMWKPGLSEELNALLWLGGIGNFQKESGKAYYSSEALEKGMKKYNDTLRKICQERQVECIDLASILDKDTTVFYDDSHFNESGARKVSRILSNYILSQDPYRALRGPLLSR
ncbi:SGNH/GDSL hydrolase family protein [bacterium]|nr:MAG: SGNH/GDSL hydrolase family protein [bacterium]